MKKSIVLVLSGLLLLFLTFSCSKKEGPAPVEQPTEEETPKEAVTETEELEPVETPEIHQGMVTFFSGEVTVFDEGEWWDLQIGDLLEVEDIVKTGADSYCEIQFGETAVVRVQENTELTMSKLNLTPGESDVGLKMGTGSVLSKVQKLAGAEKFKVQTQTAVCGVRGTEFSVHSDKDNKTVLAVKEGSVAVLPSNVDVEKLKERVKDKGGDIEKIIDEIEKSAPVVEANQEMDVDETTVRETEELAKEVERVVEEIAEDEGEEASEKQLEVLAKAVEKTKENVSQKVKPAKEISKENSEKLKEIDTIEMIEIPAAKKPAEEAGEEAEEAAEEAPPLPAIYKVSLKIEPADAKIRVNGNLKGKGSFSGLYAEGTVLSFEFDSEGYFPHTMKIDISRDTNKLYRIKLAKIPESEPEPEPEAEPEPEPEPEPEVATEEISIQAAPSDAEIYLEGKRVGRGSYTESFEVGKSLTFEIRKDGYEEQTVELNVEAGMSGTRTVELVKIPAKVQVSIRVNPSDAEVYINGESQGSGSYRAAHTEGDELSVSVSKEGYEGESLSLSVGSNDISRRVTLTKMEEPPEEVRVSLSVRPSDSRILLNGSSAGSGSYSGTHLEGSTLSFSFKRKGYEDNSLSLTVSDKNINRSVSLEPLPVYARGKASDAKIVGNTVVLGGIAYSADAEGTVSAVNLEGRRIWNVSSRNKPNENSFPVVTGGYVYFSGARELVVINAKTGSVTGKRNLNGDTSHMFGRRVVALNGSVLLPGNNSLHVIDPASGNTLKEFSIPGGSRMTPGAWQGKIVIVDQKGTVLIMNGDSGKVEGQISTSAVQPVALSMNVEGNLAYFSGRKGTVVCVDLASEKLVWERSLPVGNIFTNLEVGASGVLAYAQGTIYWLNKNSGKDVSGPIQGALSPPVLKGRTAYFGGQNGLMMITSGRSSASIAVRAGTRVTSRPAVSGEQVVAGAANGEVIIMHP